MFLYQKTIDRSTLRQGFTIPVEFHSLLMTAVGGGIKRGETRAIKIMIDGASYDAQLKNQLFDESKFVGHPDVIQIRYGENSPLSKKLREVFSESWNYVEAMKALPENVGRKLTIRVPEEQQEYLALSTTDLSNVFIADCITVSEKLAIKKDVEQMTEFDFETFEPREDDTASIKEVTRVQRIRHLDRSIGDSLKRLYDYRCQMTGERIGEQYEAYCVEAHHITPFTVSMNNDTSNIIILSPLYHRIVHKVHPFFNRKTLSFEFPNGVVEQVKLNYHLGVNRESL